MIRGGLIGGAGVGAYRGVNQMFGGKIPLGSIKPMDPYNRPASNYDVNSLTRSNNNRELAPIPYGESPSLHGYNSEVPTYDSSNENPHIDDLRHPTQNTKEAFYKKGEDSQQQVDGWKSLSGGSQIHTGKGLFNFSNPYARGKDVYYHGSNPSNYKSIRDQGIKTMGEMKDQGKSMIGSVLDNEAFEKSKNMAFITSDSSAAR